MSTICIVCDGPHHEKDHKDLGTQIVESAYDNIQLPLEEQKLVHFRGYYPKNNNFCDDSDSAKSVTHLALKIYQKVVNCDDCIEIANKELDEYRDNCYCNKCVTKRKK